MKTHYIFILTTLFFIFSCQAPTEETDVLPEDVASLRKLLKDKKSESQTLQAKIDEIETKLTELDPTMVKTKTLVTSQVIAPTTFKHYLSAQGVVEADDRVNAVSEIAGRIISLTVEEGDYVRKGALIATLDLESVDKSIAELETSLNLATTVYERQARLWEQKIGSEVQYLQAKAEKERLEKTLETLEFQLTKGKIYAPMSGEIDMVVTELGEVAAPGSPIVSILNTSRLKVVADAPENLLANVRKGDMVEVSFPSLQTDAKARVSLLGRSIDASNRTFKVEMKLANQVKNLKPNLLAEVLFNDLTIENVFVIPVEVVQQEVGGDQYVFVKSTDEDGELIATKKYIQTGESYRGDIIITEGLVEGDEIIIDGARSLKEGELLTISQPKNVSVSNG